MPAKKNSNPKTSTKGAKGAKKTTKKTEPVVEPTPVVETPVVETPVVDTPVVETPVVDTYDEDFKVIGEQLKAALLLVKDLTTKFNALEKRVNRDRKVMRKKW